MSKRFEDSPVNTLAKEVAKVFGGVHAPCNADGEYYEGWAHVIVPASSNIPAYEIGLSLGGWGVNKDKVTVSISPTNRNNDISTKALNFPSAGFNINRDFQSICAGISKRVVNFPGVVDSLLEYERRKQALIDRKKGLEDHVQDVLASCPNVRVSPTDRSSNSQARLYNTSGIYFTADLYHDGTLSFERISSMSLDQAKRILAILAE
jgi:hypothetical protein